MAIYHLSTSAVSRSSGRSSTASSAYRAGAEITDQRTGITHDYTNRNGVVESKAFVMENGEQKEVDRSELWNKAEETETRKNARTAREIVVALPNELSKDERQKLVDDFSKDVAKKYGVGIDYAIHEPDKEGDQRNHHAHILMTTRDVRIEKNGTLSFGKKTDLELSNRKLKELDKPKTQDQIKAIRKHWERRTNHSLQQAGIDKSIDSRSNKDRGLAEKPTVKLGWKSSKLERMGINTYQGDKNRQIRADNEAIAKVSAELDTLKEIKQGVDNVKGETDEFKKQMNEFREGYKDFKQGLKEAQQAKENDNTPQKQQINERDRGIDI